VLYRYVSSDIHCNTVCRVHFVVLVMVMLRCRYYSTLWVTFVAGAHPEIFPWWWGGEPEAIQV